MTSFGDKIAVWEEDEDPTATVTETVRALGYPSGTIAVDEATPFFTFDGLRRAGNAYTFINAIDVTAGCRMIKSEHEIALMQTAKNITLEAHKAAARIMREGITTHRSAGLPHRRAPQARLGRRSALQRGAVRRGLGVSARRALSADAEGRRHDPDRYRRAGRRLSLRHHALLRVRRADASASATSGIWRRRRRPRALPPPNPATAARTSTSPREASSTAPASDRAMPHPACPTAPATALGWTCTNGPIS